MSPAFSPDGSRISYTTSDGRNDWNTWTVSVLGGTPRPWLVNASGLAWLGHERLLFSEKIRDSRGNHMKAVVAAHNGADARDLYVPMPKGAMAHRSFPSPDGKWVLIAEMSDRGDWLPCRLVPMENGATGWAVGPAGAACWFAAWSPDGQASEAPDWEDLDEDQGERRSQHRRQRAHLRFEPGARPSGRIGATKRMRHKSVYIACNSSPSNSDRVAKFGVVCSVLEYLLPGASHRCLRLPSHVGPVPL